MLAAIGSSRSTSSVTSSSLTSPTMTSRPMTAPSFFPSAEHSGRGSNCPSVRRRGVIAAQVGLLPLSAVVFALLDMTTLWLMMSSLVTSSVTSSLRRQSFHAVPPSPLARAPTAPAPAASASVCPAAAISTSPTVVAGRSLSPLVGGHGLAAAGISSQAQSLSLKAFC